MNSSQAKLTASTRKLVATWKQTRELWKDTQCREFEQRYMENLLGAVQYSRGVMENLDELIHRIRKDCE